MNIQYLNNNEINRNRWDECIVRAFNGNPYAFSWYLDVVCEQWDALVINDYQAVFPIPFKKRFGLFVIYQPLFTQQLGIFSLHRLSNEEQTQILQSIPKKFKMGRMQLNSSNYADNHIFKVSENVNYELPLNNDYGTLQTNYSENTKRNLKKAQKAHLHIVESEEISATVAMFQKFKLPNLKYVPQNLCTKLATLFELFKEKGIYTVYEAYTPDNELCASVLILKDSRRLVYLFSGCTPTAYQNGAQFFLVDFIIQKFSNQPFILDFEGSNDQNLARFYKGFGSEKTTYPVLFFENLPHYLITILQKMRKI